MNYYKKIKVLLEQLAPPNFEAEKEEFYKWGGFKPKVLATGKTYYIDPENIDWKDKPIKNTDASEIDPTQPKFVRLRHWVKMMQGNNRGTDRLRRVWDQVKSNIDEPSIVRIDPITGSRNLIAGNTRATLRRALGLPMKIHVYIDDVPFHHMLTHNLKDPYK